MKRKTVKRKTNRVKSYIRGRKSKRKERETEIEKNRERQ